MSWEANTGPRTTRKDAYALVGRMMANWPNAKLKRETVALYVEKMTALPRRYVEVAVESLISEGGAWIPSPGAIEDETMAVWPPTDCTTYGRVRERDGASSADSGR